MNLISASEYCDKINDNLESVKIREIETVLPNVLAEIVTDYCEEDNYISREEILEINKDMKWGFIINIVFIVFVTIFFLGNDHIGINFLIELTLYCFYSANILLACVHIKREYIHEPNNISQNICIISILLCILGYIGYMYIFVTYGILDGTGNISKVILTAISSIIIIFSNIYLCCMYIPFYIAMHIAYYKHHF